MSEIYDLVIIGSGPSGMAAAIYAQRAMLKTVVLEKGIPGGQVVNTYEVDNYPGIPDITGFELSTKMREHAEKLGIAIQTEEVMDLQLDDPVKKIITSTGGYQAKTIILATGARWKKLGVTGEEAFTGRGVSYCATCDGAFFRNLTVAVVGGGDVAVEDAIFLSRMCKKVYLLHRRDELRAVKILQEQLFKQENVEILWHTEMKEVAGGAQVEKIMVYNNKTEETYELPVDGVFVGIGTEPNSRLAIDKVTCDDRGYVITGESCETSVKGVFAAGDVRQKTLRQIVTAAADGAISVYGAERHILENF
ncbi:thioredoxin-disulfide reductase [Vallitalea pronyensis]|uniref:Thioredoxin reductase n=1 Tax=Vallitalea pronyensis TaxID=1348613 RepID=A0A8J8MNB1_9FIRM|nr:thioredoxin-disulfide reductase [Vallitalea pronyensis]QUI25067.1 thioredoxin-disulfide reductase [Vallitalea pronyensis]